MNDNTLSLVYTLIFEDIEKTLKKINALRYDLTLYEQLEESLLGNYSQEINEVLRSIEHWKRVLKSSYLGFLDFDYNNNKSTKIILSNENKQLLKNTLNELSEFPNLYSDFLANLKEKV